VVLPKRHASFRITFRSLGAEDRGSNQLQGLSSIGHMSYVSYTEGPWHPIVRLITSSNHGYLRCQTKNK
jgi:hypothetical protein